MRTKSSTTPSAAQEALLTEATPFHQLNAGYTDSSLLQVLPGQGAKEALELSSMLASSALEIMVRLTDGGMTANEIYGIRFLVQASAALVDASVRAVEFGNRQGGAL
ncbi:hypothetical protein [Pseudomonas chlororaphis]|nr:hypothetical protein [Pseudomonas chlororaphis]